MTRQYWLMKTEPDAFSFDDLVARPNKTEHWDGVRNYQARNLMRDEMKKGDLVFIYHSRVPEPGVVGIAEIVKEGYPDHTALDPQGKYFDEKSAAKGESRWFMVDVKAKQRLARTVTLNDMKEESSLRKMKVVQRGMRLSVQPVTEKEWQTIVKMGGTKKL
jgi:predicted RNA-binding protein with PUA-like domain